MQTTHIPTDEEYQAMLRTVMSRMGQKGGRSKSPAKLAALEENRKRRKNLDGRPATTPDGIARKALRNALEAVFGKPLTKEGPIAKLVHKMSSANVVRKAWPSVEPLLPPNSVENIHEKLVALIDVLERGGGPTLRRRATPASPTAPVWGSGWGKRSSGPSTTIVDGQEVEWDEPVR